MHPITGWLPILTRAKQMKSLERNERITLRQVTRIYHWFRSVQLHFIIPKLILSFHAIYQKCVIFISQIWIFDGMRDSHNVNKIGLIFSALSKSACGGLVRQVRHFVQPCHFNVCFVNIAGSWASWATFRGNILNRSIHAKYPYGTALTEHCTPCLSSCYEVCNACWEFLERIYDATCLQRHYTVYEYM